MSAEPSITAAPSTVVETARGKVTNLRIGKYGRAIRLGRKLLKRAGLRPGAKLQVSIMTDGSIVLRPEPPQADSTEALLFEKCAQAVLENRRELLERLAK